MSDKENNAYKKRLKIPKGDNEKPLIEEGHTLQWPKEKVQPLLISIVFFIRHDKQTSNFQYENSGG
jgi:hypothetical protein